MAASYILKSSCIFDGIHNSPVSGGVVIENERITGIFDSSNLNNYIDCDTHVIDYHNQLIMPGFIDSHTHMGQNMDFMDETYCVDLGSAQSMQDVLMLLKDFNKRNPDCNVIYGMNFNFFNLTPRELPTKELLDLYFPDKAAVIQTWELHTFYTNSIAIKLAKVTPDTPDPNNNIGKDCQGQLTGVFNDTAILLIQKIVERPLSEREHALTSFMNTLNRYGITSVADMFPCGSELPYPLFKKLEDKLTVRISFYPCLTDFKEEDIIRYNKDYLSPMLQFGGLKYAIDGVISVHTAWMSEPYYDKPDTCGTPTVSLEDVRKGVLYAHSKGISVRLHTIGDEAVHFALDTLSEAVSKYGFPAKANVMEHLEYVRDDDISRFNDLNIVCSMQGRHITFYVDDGEKIMGPDRVKLAFRWKDLIHTGATMATGSDYPVVHFNPARCIYAAITRKNEEGHPENGWLPDQCISLADILKAYTYGSACAIGRQHDIGSIEPAKYADLVVLDCNLFDIKPENILDMKPVLTMLNGKIVYQQ